MKQFVVKYLKYFVLGVLIYFPVFGYLDTLPIRIWDESRLAINAYEMHSNGNYIVTHFNGEPDMWNTKPPVLIWLQVFFMKTIGVNELSVRLPSAFSAFFTCLTLLIFSLRYLKSFWFGFIAIVVLISTHGYINFHASRTGDYDALLTLFTTTSGLFFFSFTETNKIKFVYLFFLATVLAVLTKGIAGLLFIPALVIYSFWQKQIGSILKNKHFYFGTLFFLLITIGYYFLRDFYNPGYIAAVQENEMGGRFLIINENHSADFWYYYNNFINFQISHWHLFIPCGIAIGLFGKNIKLNPLTKFTFSMTLCFFLVISFSQTKLEWYDVPIYPWMAILIAVFINYIFELLKTINVKNHRLEFGTLQIVFLFLIFVEPYQKIIQKTYKPAEYIWDKEFYEIGYFLKDAIKGKYEVNNCFLLFEGYRAHIDFYVKILNDKGVKISFKDWAVLSPGDKVIAYQSSIKDYLHKNYVYKIVANHNNVSEFKILKKLDGE
jgi:4-amino-4-deoxy-L-arabinose transferase-like glycosyltransferase